MTIEDLEATDSDNTLSLEVTVSGLYERLLLEDELILDIDEDEYEGLKQALISYKGKANMKLKARNLPPDNSKLTFESVRTEPNELGEGVIRIKVSLTKKKTFTIHNITKPTDF